MKYINDPPDIYDVPPFLMERLIKNLIDWSKEEYSEVFNYHSKQNLSDSMRILEKYSHRDLLARTEEFLKLKSLMNDEIWRILDSSTKILLIDVDNIYKTLNKH